MKDILSSLSEVVHRSSNSIELWEGLCKTLITYAAEILEEFLNELDKELFDEIISKNVGCKSGGKTLRTIQTLLGPITFKRHLIYDASQNPSYPLDKALGIVPRMRFSPDLWGKIAEIATSAGMTYRLTADTLNTLSGIGISHTTVKRLVDTAGKAQEMMDEDLRNKIFEKAEIPDASSIKQIFCEVDGLYVKGIKGKIEIKNQVSYTGWERDGKRCKLRDKQMFSTVESADAFWEGSYAKLRHRYDLEGSEVVVNGDGAEWIGSHIEDTFYGASKIIRQLDPFHVQRAIKRGLKDLELRRELEKSVKNKDINRTKAIIDTALGNAATPQEEKKITIMGKYLLRNWEFIKDWKTESSYTNIDARNMGTIESNQRRLAYRMKRRGMKWSKEGAQAVAKVQQGVTNGELNQALSQYTPVLSIKRPIKRIARRVVKHMLKDCYLPPIHKINVANAPASSFIGHLSKRVSEGGFLVCAK
jgi:hypothetical protein